VPGSRSHRRTGASVVMPKRIPSLLSPRTELSGCIARVCPALSSSDVAQFEGSPRSAFALGRLGSYQGLAALHLGRIGFDIGPRKQHKKNPRFLQPHCKSNKHQIVALPCLKCQAQLESIRPTATHHDRIWSFGGLRALRARALMVAARIDCPGCILGGVRKVLLFCLCEVVAKGNNVIERLIPGSYSPCISAR